MRIETTSDARERGTRRLRSRPSPARPGGRDRAKPGFEASRRGLRRSARSPLAGPPAPPSLPSARLGGGVLGVRPPVSAHDEARESVVPGQVESRPARPPGGVRARAASSSRCSVARSRASRSRGARRRRGPPRRSGGKTGRGSVLPRAAPNSPGSPRHPHKERPLRHRLVVRGAREHNLKDVSLDLPRDAPDRLHRAVRLGQVQPGLRHDLRRGPAALRRVAVGLRPAVPRADGQARRRLHRGPVARPSRSTRSRPTATRARPSGTITEVYDYLRLLYARAGRPHCPVCGKPIARQTPQQIVDRVLELDEGTRFQVLAPVVRGRKGEYAELFRELQTKGFSRARVDGTVISLAEPPKLKKQEKHTIEVVVDRLRVKASAKRRLTDSVETALGLSGGLVLLDFVDLPENDPHRERTFSEHLACLDDDLVVRGARSRGRSRSTRPTAPARPAPASAPGWRSTPSSSCPTPAGRWTTARSGPWSAATTSDYFGRLVEALADTLGFRTDTPWERLPAKVQKALLYGHDEQVHVRYKNRYGRERSYYTTFEGVIPFVQRRHAESESDPSRERCEGYMREVPCPDCGGARLKPVSLAVTVGGRSIAEVARMPIADASVFLRSVDLSPREAQIAERVLKEVNARLRFLLDVGLDYLSLDRPAGDAGRRRGAADPARDADRLRPRRACSTCSTSRASGCTSATTGG